MSVFDTVKSTVEAHPYLIGGVALGAIVVVAYHYSGSSASNSTTSTTSAVPATSTTTGVDDTLLEAELQASSQQAALQVQAQLQNNQTQAQLTAQQTSEAVANNANILSYNLGVNTNATNLAKVQANDQTQVSIAQIQEQGAVAQQQEQYTFLQTVLNAFGGTGNGSTTPKQSPTNTTVQTSTYSSAPNTGPIYGRNPIGTLPRLGVTAPLQG